MTALISLAKQGDKNSLEQAVKKNSALVWSVVRRFSSRGYDPDDLYQIGCIGLIKAIRRFEEGYGYQFSTYAVPLISGEIKRFLRDDGIIKVSRHYKEINQKAIRESALLEAELMREPTVGEIASRLGIGVFELTEAMEACTPCDSIYRTVTQTDGKEMYILDKLFDRCDDTLPDMAALRQAIDNLTEREKTIVAYRYFMDETQSKVAERLGISQVQVSRIEKKILANLKENLTI